MPHLYRPDYPHTNRRNSQQHSNEVVVGLEICVRRVYNTSNIPGIHKIIIIFGGLPFIPLIISCGFCMGEILVASLSPDDLNTLCAIVKF
ncbi:MAG: hypothetical protein KAS74_07040 [Methanosarcinales archaeon]|nr:hypothetical protein [Methanosarcinales archaeon]